MIKEQFFKDLELQCNLTIAQSQGLPGIYCPAKFNGWTCWPDTPAGQMANMSCPDFVAGFESTRRVYHSCEEDGSWHFVEEFNKSWVNYSSCLNIEAHLFHEKIVIIQSVGYSVSLLALLISLALLFYFKSLRCARILIHMNLFASFALNNICWLLWYSVVLGKSNLLDESKWCVILHIIRDTCLISNYSWMLCEGLYLHTVLVWAFISQSRLLLWMLIIGWGVPILQTLLYVPLRVIEDGTEECWVQESRYIIIQQILVVVVVIVNCLFLINIVRVLVIKLRRGPANDGSGASRSSLQALRATLLLVPLFGVNYLLTPFRPNEGSSWEKPYEVVSAIITSFQGLCVAILFCFCNGEVQAQVQRKWKTVMFRPRANSCTVTTVSFVRSAYPANGEEKV